MGYTKAVAALKIAHRNFPVRALQAVWRGYTYLYYRIYAWNLRMWGESDLPQWNAMLGVAVLSGVNVMTLVLSLLRLSGMDLLNQGTPKLLLWICATGWFFINYLFLIRGGKYKRIVAYFSSGKHINARLGMWLCWSYGVLTFVLLGISAVFA